MKKLLFITAILLLPTHMALIAQTNYTIYVNPFIGTSGTGHTHPAATTPFGMVQLGPDNDIKGWEYSSGYNSKSTYIMGFSHTHLSGTGCLDMGDIMFMPVTNLSSFNQNNNSNYGSHFSHKSEKASPGYYSVFLNDYKINVQLTATPHAGFHKYSYPDNNNQQIIIDLEHGIGDKTTESFIQVIDNKTIAGLRRSTGFINNHQYYFYAHFSKPFSKIISCEDGTIGNKTYISGKNTKILLQFSPSNTKEIEVKVGLSTTSYEKAKQNVDKEIQTWNFAEVKRQTNNLWNNYLKRITVKTINTEQRVSFYTSLYHTLLMPNLITDVDGSYVGWDHSRHISKVGNLYTNFSLWDTYRALHPFLNLIYPKINHQLVKSMLEHYKQTGLLPTNEYGLCETWCMIGNHAIPVIVDDILKGDHSINVASAYEAIKHSQITDHPKSDWNNYNKYGYFPYDISGKESVSRTMEACYDDYCVAIMAKKIQKEDDYNFFIKRSANYKNLFDSNTMFVRPRSSNGEWKKIFNPYSLINEKGIRDYTEGNAWQWTWHVQHDAAELISLFGSKQNFTTKLDSLFFTQTDNLPGSSKTPDVTGLVGLYAQGNEPSHHVAYLYNYVGRPDRTADIIRIIFDKYYLPKRDGLCGNDDCGQMSAWYIFSGMGFYPLNPISGKYVIGAPQFKTITLSLPNGKKFKIKAKNISVTNKYVKSLRLNGVKINPQTISYKNILDGGSLEYDMCDKPM